MLPRLKLQIATNSKPLTVGCVVLGVVLLLGSGYVFLTPPVEEPASQPDPQPDPQFETIEYDTFFLEVEVIDSATVNNPSESADRSLSGPSDQALSKGDEIIRAPEYDTEYTDELTFNITANTTQNTTVKVKKRLFVRENITASEEYVVDSRENLLMYRENSIQDGWISNKRTFDIQNDIYEPQDSYTPRSLTRNTTLILDIDYNTTEEINGEYYYTGSFQMESDINYNTDNNDEVTTYSVDNWELSDDYNNISLLKEGNKQIARVSKTESRRNKVQSKASTSQDPTKSNNKKPDMRLVALLAVLGLVAVASGGAIAAKAPQLDEEVLKTEIAHNQYSEWISEGDLLLDSDNEFVAVNSIEDLVNVGIDANKRVIYDPDLSVYTVSDDDVTYYYTTDPADLQRWTHL